MLRQESAKRKEKKGQERKGKKRSCYNGRINQNKSKVKDEGEGISWCNEKLTYIIKYEKKRYTEYSDKSKM